MARRCGNFVAPHNRNSQQRKAIPNAVQESGSAVPGQGRAAPAVHQHPADVVCGTGACAAVLWPTATGRDASPACGRASARHRFRHRPDGPTDPHPADRRRAPVAACPLPPRRSADPAAQWAAARAGPVQPQPLAGKISRGAPRRVAPPERGIGRRGRAIAGAAPPDHRCGWLGGFHRAARRLGPPRLQSAPPQSAQLLPDHRLRGAEWAGAAHAEPAGQHS